MEHILLYLSNNSFLDFWLYFRKLSDKKFHDTGEKHCQVVRQKVINPSQLFENPGFHQFFHDRPNFKKFIMEVDAFFQKKQEY